VKRRWTYKYRFDTTIRFTQTIQQYEVYLLWQVTSLLSASRKNLLNKLSEAIKQETSKAGADERFWKLTIDQKTGIGYAKLRFLPAAQERRTSVGARVPARIQGTDGSWLIENCPTTLGQRPCPICKNNSELWNTNDKANKKIARDRKRKLNYISNILVIEDPSHIRRTTARSSCSSTARRFTRRLRTSSNRSFPTRNRLTRSTLVDDGDAGMNSS
jgi:hypothetical protein